MLCGSDDLFSSIPWSQWVWLWCLSTTQPVSWMFLNKKKMLGATFFYSLCIHRNTAVPVWGISPPTAFLEDDTLGRKKDRRQSAICAFAKKTYQVKNLHKISCNPLTADWAASYLVRNMGVPIYLADWMPQIPIPTPIVPSLLISTIKASSTAVKDVPL